MRITSSSARGHVRHEQIGGIHLLILSHAEKRNALSLEMVESLLQSFAAARSEPARTVVLLGEGPSFCAGADVHLLRADLLTARHFYRTYADLLFAVRTHPSSVVAGIQGYALGGGAEIAMEADFRVMSRDAVIGYPDVAIGSTPATTRRLVSIVGDAHARRLVLLGEQVKADEAERLGIALQLVDTHEEVCPAAIAVAERAAAVPRLSMLLAKEALDLSPTTDFRQELLFNARAMALCHTTDDQRRHADEFLRQADDRES